MSDKKRLPIGILDFSEVIKENYYYVDKTKMIEDLLVNGDYVSVFTRPSKFGKTLNLSMLKSFFNIKGREENRKLFKNLYINKSPVFGEQGKYPVVHISFKNVTGENWEEILLKFNSVIRNLYKENIDIYDGLDEFSRKDFNDIINVKEKFSYITDLKSLMSYLYKHYNRKVVVLIDDFEIPLISAYKCGCHNEATDFFEVFLGATLKGNQYLKLGIVTGVIKVAQENMWFPSFDNYRFNSVLRNGCSQYFGLLKSEVEEMLKYYKMENKIEEIKSWYGGYKFGETEIYNLYSIINYIFTQKLGIYFDDFSDNYLISDLLKKSKEGIFGELEILAEGKELEKTISDEISLKRIEQEFWKLLVYGGYLKINNKISINWSIYSLKIPNKEICNLLKNLKCSLDNLREKK